MEDFKDRLKLSSSQQKEVEKYLGTIGVLNEYSILKLVRKIKQIEQRLKEFKYE